MTLERMAIAAFVRAFGQQGLEFPGMTIVQDTLHDKMQDASLMHTDLSTWERFRQDAYIRKAVSNAAYHIARKESIIKRSIKQMLVSQQKQNDFGPEYHIDQKLMLEWFVRKAIKTFSHDDCTMIAFLLSGLSVKKLAESQGINESVVRRKLVRVVRVIGELRTGE